MATRRTNQEWQTLFECYESSQLTQRAFCEHHGLSLSTFYAKRQQLTHLQTPQNSGFVKAHVLEQTTRYHMTQAPTANMTLSVNDVELSIPQGTPASYSNRLINHTF
ncbi:IS66 family insertion sequence element accessory protein TnpA [Photobacterium damselae]